MDEIGTTLWRVRTVLTDRPGALARLAGACGEAGVNILALQIFPDVGSVTDELVLSTPSDWTVRRVQELMLEAGVDSSKGAPQVSQAPPSSLTDQPVRSPRHCSRDGWPPRPARPTTAPWTCARAVDRCASCATRRYPPPPRPRRRGWRWSPPGCARGQPRPTRPRGREPEGAGVRVHVVPAWRGRGLGARLLREVCALGRMRGESALVARVPAHDVAALRLLLGSGLCGRIRSDGGETVARLVVGQLTTA